MEPTVGAVLSKSVTVNETNTAKIVGSGDLDVFATPMMIALMEQAAAGCLAQFLPEGQSSVGTRIETTHDAATPLGMTVTATATITAVDRRKVDFLVEATDGTDVIGKGTHTRFIIDAEKFMAKAAAKSGK